MEWWCNPYQFTYVPRARFDDGQEFGRDASRVEIWFASEVSLLRRLPPPPLCFSLPSLFKEGWRESDGVVCFAGVTLQAAPTIPPTVFFLSPPYARRGGAKATGWFALQASLFKQLPPPRPLVFSLPSLFKEGWRESDGVVCFASITLQAAPTTPPTVFFSPLLIQGGVARKRRGGLLCQHHSSSSSHHPAHCVGTLPLTGERFFSPFSVTLLHLS